MGLHLADSVPLTLSFSTVGGSRWTTCPVKHMCLPWWLKLVKNLPAMQETQVQFLGWEDSLEEGMAIHSSIPESHGQRSLAGYSPWDCRVGHNWGTDTFFKMHMCKPWEEQVGKEIRVVPDGRRGRKASWKKWYLKLHLDG